MKRLVLAGINGKMGSFLLAGLKKHPKLEVVAGVCLKEDLKRDIPVYNDLEKLLESETFDIYIDFTLYDFALPAIKKMLANKVAVIVGTTGFTEPDIAELQAIAKEHDTSGIIAPNFAIGAILILKFADIATKYFKDFAVYEYHHTAKHDNPSGTALYIADAIEKNAHTKVEPVYGMRLPGVLATHHVIMSDETQKIELVHQSNNRHSFEEGVILAIEKLDKVKGLIYGLENVLEIE